MKKDKKVKDEILEYQPDAVEIEDRPVPGRARWVLYLILAFLVSIVVWASVFKVDRIVTAEGELITNAPSIVVQTINTAVIRGIHAEVGQVVEKDQVLATLDSTFTSADVSQLKKQETSLSVQIRRIRAELNNEAFVSQPEEGDQGKLQEQLLRQRRLVVEKNRRMTDDKIAALRAKLALNAVQRKGQEQQHKLLRDIEGTTAKRPKQDDDHRLRLLEAQKTRHQSASSIEELKAEEAVTRSELKQVESEWRRFIEERHGELLEQEVQLRTELEKVHEELSKAERMHELISLKAPEKGIVLKMADRSVGSVLQPAEPFIVLVPYECLLEAEVDVEGKDIGRIRVGDAVRVKLDAFPFQRHDTLAGEVRVISENATQRNDQQALLLKDKDEEGPDTVYKTRVRLLSTTLRNVPEGFRLMPGMKVRAEIKVGKRAIITYFLYPIIRSLDESLREP